MIILPFGIEPVTRVVEQITIRPGHRVGSAQPPRIGKVRELSRNATNELEIGLSL